MLLSIRSTYQEGEKMLQSRAMARFSRFKVHELLVFPLYYPFLWGMRGGAGFSRRSALVKRELPESLGVRFCRKFAGQKQKKWDY